MICSLENRALASKTIGYIQFRLSGVHMSTERAKYAVSADTDQIIAHMRSRLGPAVYKQFGPEKETLEDDFIEC